MKANIQQFFQTYQRQIIVIGAVIVFLLVVVQIVYPGSKLPLFTKIDGKNVGGWEKQDVVWWLDKQAKRQKIAITLGESQQVYSNITPNDIGLKVGNTERIERIDYPWYMRLVPTSLFWWHWTTPRSAPSYQRDEAAAQSYLNKTLGKSCNIPAQDASLKASGASLELVPAKNGGVCREEQAIQALMKVEPRLSQRAEITIPVEVKRPKVSDATARKLGQRLEVASQNGVVLRVASDERTIAQKEVLSWLEFSVRNRELTYDVSVKKAEPYLTKTITPLVAKPSGTSVVTTRDFTVLSEKIGATGRTLAQAATLQSVKKVLDGEADQATATVTSLPPKVIYTRSYTKTSTGVAALLLHYDEDHPGVFGVSFQELSGRYVASHNASRQFTTASTYKLFVAYGTLRKIDAGTWKWTDKNIAGGRNMATCFDDMIVKSDNECAKALLEKYGLRKLTDDIRALGLSSSGFTQGDTPLTTAGDLTLLLYKLQTNQLPIKSDSRVKWIDAMKRNIYRQGIPAGASGQVADKVGFLWGLLHDAAIVYSPKGTYVLTVLTDGSSWANIAELTRKIEALR